jgi:hypothetical protein
MAQLRIGIHRLLEDEADRLIKESLKNVTKHSEKSDILTPWKQMDRYRREVYSRSGVVDPSIRQGMFRRASNPSRPELNSRDGVARPRNSPTSMGGFSDGFSERDD